MPPLALHTETGDTRGAHKRAGVENPLAGAGLGRFPNRSPRLAQMPPLTLEPQQPAAWAQLLFTHLTRDSGEAPLRYLRRVLERRESAGPAPLPAPG